MKSPDPSVDATATRSGRWGAAPGSPTSLPGETAVKPKEGAPPLSPVSAEELARLFEEFSEATRRMQDSHHVLEERVAELREELAEKNLLLERKKRLEALGLMAAGVAHEIRNPLGSISLYLDCLTGEVRGPSSPTESLRLIRQIEEAVAHLNSVVENMLVFTSPSPTEREECDLRILLEEAAQLLRGSLETSGSILRTEGSPADTGPTLVPGDRDQIRCVLLNVLKNAIQATGKGGIVTVRFSPARKRTGQVCVAILDNGPGIPRESMEKVFVPFFTDGKKKGGVGLGLTIVHSLMERQGGRIELENIPGGGLEVRLLFSATPDREDYVDLDHERATDYELHPGNR